MITGLQAKPEWGAHNKCISFRNMQHGWVVRGDTAIPEVCIHSSCYFCHVEERKKKGRKTDRKKSLESPLHINTHRVCYTRGAACRCGMQSSARLSCRWSTSAATSACDASLRLR